MDDLEVSAGIMFSDCPNREHDPFRRVNQPCRLCEVGKVAVEVMPSIAATREFESLRVTNVCLKAENAKLRTMVEAQAKIIKNGGCVSEAHAIIKKLRAELAQRDDEASTLVAEIRRLQSELAKCHA